MDDCKKCVQWVLFFVAKKNTRSLRVMMKITWKEVGVTLATKHDAIIQLFRLHTTSPVYLLCRANGGINAKVMTAASSTRKMIWRRVESRSSRDGCPLILMLWLSLFIVVQQKHTCTWYHHVSYICHRRGRTCIHTFIQVLYY